MAQGSGGPLPLKNIRSRLAMSDTRKRRLRWLIWCQTSLRSSGKRGRQDHEIASGVNVMHSPYPLVKLLDIYDERMHSQNHVLLSF